MDGLSCYLNEPLQWAVDVILDQIDDIHSCNKVVVGRIVESSYEFISQSFAELGLTPPSRSNLFLVVVEQIEAKRYVRLVYSSCAK